MKLFKIPTYVCQNCIHGNNEKGKWIKRLFHNWDKKGYWHVFCEKNKRFHSWDKHKHCFEPKRWVLTQKQTKELMKKLKKDDRC